MIAFENVDMGCGVGKDYKGGRVTIVGKTYDNAIPASTLDHGKEGKIHIQLDSIPAEKLEGARLHACVGVDAFAGDESQKRKMYAVRTRGTMARFVTVIEPYETESVIREVLPVDENTVTVLLKDGRRQTVRIENMDDMENRQVRILMEECLPDGKIEVEVTDC